MKIFVDIGYSFIRQPIKIAINNTLKDTVEFVLDEDTADLVIGTPEDCYNKPTILLTDDPHQYLLQNNVLDICPTPTNQDEMNTLVFKVIDILRALPC